MTFNVNCSDCVFCGKSEYYDSYVCCHPRMVLAAGGFWLIEDIKQNVDCMFFEEYKNPTINEKSF